MSTINEQEEFEFRLRAEKEAASSKSQQTMQPDLAAKIAAPFVSGIRNAVGGIAEPVMQMATGFAAKPMGEIAALGTMAANQLTDNEVDPAAMAKDVQEKLTYQPRTTAGASEFNPLNAIPAAIGGVVGYGAGKVGEATKAVTGSDIAAAGAKEAALQGVGLLGVGKASRMASAAPEKVATKQAELDTLKSENLARDTIREKGQKHGLLAPAESGLKQTAADITNADRVISNKNAVMATRAIREQDLGMKKGGSLSPDTLEIQKKDHYKEYENLVNEAKLPQKYKVDSSILDAQGNPVKRTVSGTGLEVTDSLRDSIKSQVIEMEKELTQSPTVFKSNIESIKVLKEQLNNPLLDPQITLNQIKRLRNQAKIGFKSDDYAVQETAGTRIKLANDLEQVFVDNLEKHGKQGVVEKFRKAREQLAKIHALENVVTEGGMVNIRKLASLKDKYPLTGAMKDIAEFGSEFERASLPSTTKGSIGFMDIAKTTAYATAGHGMIGLGELVGRGGIPMLAKRGYLQTKTPSYKVGAINRGVTASAPYATGLISAQIPSQQKRLTDYNK